MLEEHHGPFQDFIMTRQSSANHSAQDSRVHVWAHHLGKVAGPIVFAAIGILAIAYLAFRGLVFFRLVG